MTQRKQPQQQPEQSQQPPQQQQGQGSKGSQSGKGSASSSGGRSSDLKSDRSSAEQSKVGRETRQDDRNSYSGGRTGNT